MSRTVLAGMLGLGLMACSGAAAREPERAAARGKVGDRALDRTLVAGTLIEAQMDRGGTLTATVTADVTNGRRWVVIPAGSRVGLRITRWGPATNTRQADARITLEVLSVTVRGRLYPVRETVKLTAPALSRPRGEVVAVAPGTRILFVLSEGFTAAMPRAGIP